MHRSTWPRSRKRRNSLVCPAHLTPTTHVNVALLASFERASFRLALPPKTNLQCFSERAISDKKKRKNHVISLAHSDHASERHPVTGEHGPTTLAITRMRSLPCSFTAIPKCFSIGIEMPSRARKLRMAHKLGKWCKKRASHTPEESSKSAADTSAQPSGTVYRPTPRCRSPTQRQPPIATASSSGHML
ncbi:hypothetical protein HPB51_017477 [Rhipicephalus microplus]|uniref:Uncharacterized protein n=1 Tax=Rhipicephalus microplus TaxID=6941 RepID=A0A9J6F4P2_RHIMP|nr:hypothetical protein HPB51_017477 [Rhipicephalus microplus]